MRTKTKRMPPAAIVYAYMMSIDRLGSAGEGVWEKWLVKSIEKVWID